MHYGNPDRGSLWDRARHRLSRVSLSGVSGRIAGTGLILMVIGVAGLVRLVIHPAWSVGLAAIAFFAAGVLLVFLAA